MNIFVLDADPKKSANKLHPMHYGKPKPDSKWGCPKMALEGLQMLANAYHRYQWPIHRKINGDTYSHKCHPYHRCTIWAGEDIRNTAWLLRHTISIILRYMLEADKRPTIFNTVEEAYNIFHHETGEDPKHFQMPGSFAIADGLHPADGRYDIDYTIKAYEKYYSTKGY